MTKADIVDKVSKDTGMEKFKVTKVIESFMDTVKTSLSKDENVYLRGFGSFVVKQRAEKKGRDIRANTTVIIPAGKVPGFKASKDFKL